MSKEQTNTLLTFRPTDYHYFGDTSAYAMAFQKKAFYGTVAIRDRDIGFEYLTYWLSQLVNLKVGSEETAIGNMTD